MVCLLRQSLGDLFVFFGKEREKYRVSWKRLFVARLDVSMLDAKRDDVSRMEKLGMIVENEENIPR